MHEQRPHRYRITITPVQDDGYPCVDRCSIEFEHRASQDWLRLMHHSQRHRQLSADERAATLVASRVLRDLAHAHRNAQEDPFDTLEPVLDRFIAGIDPRR
ncbi:DUF3861 family protein [Pseudoxanthomonas sp. JBR18]|uniref:DUF3861 family protein n=1 Tax=Pseudoxanthomonas sp. JBR18 TaxID=2969308 RepID=UPI0023050BD3|nr:DUF3861 family protein [Pseudoxanthomonas sp. JBR18]WCE04333.1 DUF3861 family protein [Pseudoxanthomonas sp. JBR18]